VEYTNQQWTAFIEEKIKEVINIHNPTSEIATEFSSIKSTSDPRFARAIDHTLLKPDTTFAQIERLCDEAIKYNFKSCCVNGIYVRQVAQRLEGSETIVCCVVGFPLGAGSSEAIISYALCSLRISLTTRWVISETKLAVSHGAREIDTVIPLALLKDRRYSDLYKHLSGIVSAASPYPTKVILETVFLSHEEIIAACVVAKAAGALWVKTSTGFLGGGADENDVQVMWKATRGDNANGQQVHVKASGGVRTFDACLKMLRAGAERIGTSSGAAIMEETEITGSSVY